MKPVMVNKEELLEDTLFGEFKAQSKIIFFLDTGKQLSIDVPLQPDDFISIYESIKKDIILPTGEHSYAVIKKKHVICYQVLPV